MRRILVLVSLCGMAAGVSAGRPADLSPHQMDDPASPPALTAAATRLMDPQRSADAALAAAAPICGVNKALATTTRFCNTAALQFPDAGAASQYPSDIVVSNLAGVVTDVDLVLADVTHTDTSRLAAYLQHPGGQLVGITGSGFDVNAAPFPLVINAQWTFSDSAQIYALLTGSNGSPSYTVPTTNNRYLPRVFAPPALPAPAPAAGARQMLSSLEGLNPNGTWRLWAAQNTGTDPQPFGTIADGWCLDITTAPAAGSCYFTTTRTGSLNAGDVQQTGRITRDGRPSLCGGPTKTPTLENTTAVRRAPVRLPGHFRTAGMPDRYGRLLPVRRQPDADRRLTATTIRRRRIPGIWPTAATAPARTSRSRPGSRAARRSRSSSTKSMRARGAAAMRFASKPTPASRRRPATRSSTAVSSS